MDASDRLNLALARSAYRYGVNARNPVLEDVRALSEEIVEIEFRNSVESRALFTGANQHRVCWLAGFNVIYAGTVGTVVGALDETLTVVSQRAWITVVAFVIWVLANGFILLRSRAWFNKSMHAATLTLNAETERARLEELYPVPEMEQAV